MHFLLIYTSFYASSIDLRIDISISFEEAVFGKQHTIEFEHLETCPDCKGHGGAGKKTCPHCNGQGQVKTVARTPLGSFTQISVCPHCHGTGQVIEKPCEKCHGQGQITKSRKIDIKMKSKNKMSLKS